MSDSKENNKIVVITIVSLIVGFGFGWITFGGQGNASPENATDISRSEQKNINNEEKESSKSVTPVAITGTQTSVSEPAQIAIRVSDQPAGETVVVDSIALKQTGWVAVQEDRNGLPGNILGVQRLSVGEYDAVTVHLLRATVAGGRNYITVFNDDGDGTFDHKKDLLLVDSEGEVIMSSFTTTENAVIVEETTETTTEEATTAQE